MPYENGTNHTDKPPDRRHGLDRRANSATQFTLSTIFSLTTVAAILSFILSRLVSDWGISGILIGLAFAFVLIVSIARSLLFEGSRPGLVSIVAGILLAGALAMLGFLTPFRERGFIVVLRVLVVGGLAGILAGWIADVTVAIVDYQCRRDNRKNRM